jgi:maleylacetate reductase
VTDEASGRKAGFADPRAVPPVVILDPEATLFTPQKLWLSTGIRALDHAVEGLLFGEEHPVTDVTGLEGARRLMEYLPRSKEEPEDIEARLELQDRGELRGAARIHLVHHPRAEPASCEDRVPEDRWRELTEALGGDPAGRVSALVEVLDLPRRLRDVGVPEEDLKSMAREFGDRERYALTILRRAL